MAVKLEKEKNVVFIVCEESNIMISKKNNSSVLIKGYETPRQLYLKK